MYWNHTNWFETLQSMALFYPKLAASMVAIATANSMKPFSRPLTNSAPNQVEAPSPGAPPPLLAAKRRSAARKPSKARKSSKRAHSRRKAA